MNKKNGYRAFLLSNCSVLALTASILPGWAHSSDSFELEEVVVTAQKRESSLLDTPISITAVTGDALEQSGVEMFDDIAGSIPGVSFNNTSELTNNRITIRGVSNFQQSPSIDPANAFYLDEVFLGSDLGSQISFFDVERVEVLRGPQGTLFGRNSVGGAINVISRKPTNEFEAAVRVSAGNYNSRRLDASINGALIEDTLMGRLSISDSSRDGFTDNLEGGADLNDYDRTSARARVDYLANDALTFSFTADYATSKQKTRAFDVLVDGYGIDADPKDRKVSISDPGGEEFETTGASVTIDYDFGDVGFKSITSYRDQDYEREINAAATPFDLARDFAPEQADVFSQELRLASQTDGPLEWVTGLYYYTRDLDFSPTILLGSATGSSAGLSQDRVVSTENSSYSAYVHTTYRLADQWSLILGLRYTEEDKDMDLTLAGALRGSNTGQLDIDDSWNALTPLATVMYDFSESGNIYFTYSEGFKSGGFNELAILASGNQAYDQEEVKNYEIGVKGRLWNDRVQYSLATYYMEWQDLQVEQLVNSAVLFETFVGNTGEARSRGVEAELTVLARENLLFNLGLAYNDGEVRESSSPTVVEGNSLSDSPLWSFNASVDYHTPINDLYELFVSSDYSWRDDHYVGSPENNPLAKQDGYGLLNAQLGVRSSDDKYSLYLWGKNLTDEDAFTRVFDLTDNSLAQRALVALNAPRTYGITLVARFD